LPAGELSEALIVNPYDLRSVSEAIGQALRMSDAADARRGAQPKCLSLGQPDAAGCVTAQKAPKIMLMASRKANGAFIQGHFGKLRQAR
jgi:hypothetical protein